MHREYSACICPTFVLWSPLHCITISSQIIKQNVNHKHIFVTLYYSTVVCVGQAMLVHMNYYSTSCSMLEYVNIQCTLLLYIHQYAGFHPVGGGGGGGLETGEKLPLQTSKYAPPTRDLTLNLINCMKKIMKYESSNFCSPHCPKKGDISLDRKLVQ